ncbi:MAG: Na/Pi cotransporter family protein [Alphaproteobacteria bacterium]|nr:Na/Pi cotransporter family protein [Alphaproteobacteria bacterium]
MVRRHFVHAYGPHSRALIYSATKNRVRAFISGMAITALLQSSTATIILLTSFAKKNLVPLSAAIATVLGADVGTTLAAQVLALDLSWMSPLLLAGGVGLFMAKKKEGRPRDIAQILIGLGLMLLALSLIREAVVPLKNSSTLPLILAPLRTDPILALLLSTLLTWVLHSSLASVLLFSSLAAGGVIDLHLGIWFVLGANIGGALVALGTTYHSGVAARRITVANLLMRAATVTIFMPLTPFLLSYAEHFELEQGRAALHIHTGFNILVALIFLPFVNSVADFCRKILPAQRARDDEKSPHFLDEKSLDSPAIALSGAARETLRMAEMVETMLEQTIKSFESENPELIRSIRRQDNTVDSLYSSIKLYMIRMSRDAMDERQADRYMQILSFATDLEHIGDVIDKNLMELAEKKNRRQDRFSPKGLGEIQDFHNRVMDNLRLAQTIFMSEDKDLARKLVEGKQKVREAADVSSEQHFTRLREGLKESLATSSLHLDIIRDYRRINSYATKVAYSILSKEKKSIPVE